MNKRESIKSNNKAPLEEWSEEDRGELESKESEIMKISKEVAEDRSELVRLRTVQASGKARNVLEDMEECEERIRRGEALIAKLQEAIRKLNDKDRTSKLEIDRDRSLIKITEDDVRKKLKVGNIVYARTTSSGKKASMEGYEIIGIGSKNKERTFRLKNSDGEILDGEEARKRVENGWVAGPSRSDVLGKYGTMDAVKVDSGTRIGTKVQSEQLIRRNRREELKKIWGRDLIDKWTRKELADIEHLLEKGGNMDAVRNLNARKKLLEKNPLQYFMDESEKGRKMHSLDKEELNKVIGGLRYISNMGKVEQATSGNGVDYLEQTITRNPEIKKAPTLEKAVSSLEAKRNARAEKINNYKKFILKAAAVLSLAFLRGDNTHEKIDATDKDRTKTESKESALDKNDLAKNISKELEKASVETKATFTAEATPTPEITPTVKRLVQETSTTGEPENEEKAEEEEKVFGSVLEANEPEPVVPETREEEEEIKPEPKNPLIPEIPKEPELIFEPEEIPEPEVVETIPEPTKVELLKKEIGEQIEKTEGENSEKKIETPKNYETAEKDVNLLLTEDQWENLKDVPANIIIKNKDLENNSPGVYSLAKYLTMLINYAGINPKGSRWLGLKPPESAEDFRNRAMEKLEKEGKLQEFEESLRK